MSLKNLKSALRELRTQSGDLAAALQSRRRSVAIFAIEVRGENDAESIERIQRISEIAVSLRAEVTSILSTTVVLAFGMLQFLDQQKPAAKRLPERLKNEFGDNHRLIQTQQEVWCDHVSVTPPRMAFLWPELDQMLTALRAVSWGKHRDFRPDPGPANDPA